MLPVWQEVPHHSVGPGLVFNCAKRQRAEPRVNLYHVSSPFCGRLHPHMYTIRQRQTFERWAFWSCMLVCKLSLTHTLSLYGLVMYPPFESKIQYVVAVHTLAEVKVSVWQDIFLTLLLSLTPSLSVCLFLTHSLFHSVVIGMCVCAGADCETDEWPAMADS